MELVTPVVVELCIGVPRAIEPGGLDEPFGPLDSAGAAPWSSSIFRQPSPTPVRLTRNGFDGDAQADQANHGGVDKAVCVYPASHYAAWREQLGITPFDFGAFGENLTMTALDEGSVCLGDVWAVGTAVLQVSQPRKPCWKLARKWRRQTLTDEVVRSGRTGWYLRVLQEGVIGRGDRVTRLERLHPEWTVAAANAVMHERTGDLAGLESLEVLAPAWREALRKRLSSFA